MYLLLGSPKNILKFKQSATNMEPSSFRNKVPIAIIDDQDFPYNDLLRDHQYNLNPHFPDKVVHRKRYMMV